MPEREARVRQHLERRHGRFANRAFLQWRRPADAETTQLSLNLAG